jgi:hypothetical protein
VAVALNRRRFLAGLVATVSGLLVPTAPAIVVPERRCWSLDRSMIADDRIWLAPGPGFWSRTTWDGDATMTYVGRGNAVHEAIIESSRGGLVRWVAYPGEEIYLQKGGRLALHRSGYRATVTREGGGFPLLQISVV